MPLFALCQYVQAGQIELLLHEWCVDPLPLHVVYPQNRHLSAKVRAFVEWVAELFADLETLQSRMRTCDQLPDGASSSSCTVSEHRKILDNGLLAS